MPHPTRPLLRTGDRATFRADGTFVVGTITGRASDGTYDLAGDCGDLIVGAAAADVDAGPAYEPRIDALVVTPDRLVGQVTGLDRPGLLHRSAYVRTPDGRTRRILIDSLRPAAQLTAIGR